MVFDRTGRSILGHIINIFLISIIPVAVFLGSKRTDTLYNLQLPTRTLSHPLLFPSQYTLLISPLLPSVLSFNHSVTVSFINVSALDFVLAVFAVVIPSVKKKRKKDLRHSSCPAKSQFSGESNSVYTSWYFVMTCNYKLNIATDCHQL